MMEILKKAGMASGIATVIVLALTAVPIWYQIESTKDQNERIAVLEAKIQVLESK